MSKYKKTPVNTISFLSQGHTTRSGKGHICDVQRKEGEAPFEEFIYMLINLQISFKRFQEFERF